jgi:HK97 family phage portal protein
MVELEHTNIHELLERPNPMQSYGSFIQELIAFGKLTGNRYIYGIAPETGLKQYKELYVLPSQLVEIHSGGIMQPVKEYSLQYNGSHKIPAEVVCHIKDFNPNYNLSGSHLYGQSPLKAGLRSLQTNNEATETGVKYLQNQTARGVLMSDEGDINEVQAQQLKDRFKQQYRGSNNAGDIVITPKKLSWINFGLNASDLSLIEQYNASIKDLCNIYNVPSVLLNNTESSTYNNVKEAKKSLYQNAILPEMLKIRDELNRWLMPQFGEKLKLDFDFTAIPELQEETEKIVNQMSSAWWLTPNEKRIATGYGVDEENDMMNTYYVPSNLLPIEESEVDPNQDGIEPINLDEDQEEKTMIIKRAVPGMDDAYTTEEEAEARAEELGGSGSHSHEDEDGNEIFMPFNSHEEYMEAIENDKNYHDEDEEKQMSARLEKALKKKADDHNEKVNNAVSKRTNVRTLYAVYKRGIGAYRTNPSSVRPSVSSPEQWAMARVNSFLYVLRNGRFRSGQHDTDLLPAEHPKSTKKKSSHNNEEDPYKMSFDGYPQSASNNAQRMLDLKEKHGSKVKGGTATGWKRAKQLASRSDLSFRDVLDIYSFLMRHKGNEKIDPKYQDEPYKDAGWVSYKLWGGKSMIPYVTRIRNKYKDD